MRPEEPAVSGADMNLETLLERIVKNLVAVVAPTLP